MYVAWDMGVSMQAPFTFLATVHACTYSKVWILFFSTPQNSALFKSYYWLLKCTCIFMWVACMCIQISLPNVFGLSLMPTWISYQLLSKSKVIWWRNWCVYIAQSVCMFHMHVFNWWDQFENMCKFGWEIMWQTDSVTE